MSFDRSLRWGSSNSKFEDPFLLPSLEGMPLQLRTALDYCLYLYIHTPMYRRAMSKVVAHFVTRLGFRGDVGSRKERKEFEEFFIEDLGGFEGLQTYGEEWSCYGTSFLRPVFPFERRLQDSRGTYTEHAVNSPLFDPSKVSFDLKTLTYRVPDPRAMHLPVDKRPFVNLPFTDRKSYDFSRIRLKNLDPRYVVLRYNDYTGDTNVVYGFTPELRKQIQDGVLHVVNTTPVGVLRALQVDNGHYEYNRQAVNILRTPTISGISNYGWGLPEILAQYSQLHKIAVLQKIDESVGRDYMLPFRVVAPNLQNVDPQFLHTLSLGWRGAANRMFSEQRLDRTKVHAFPFPLVYQELGGQGKALSPKEVREYEVNQLLAGLGIPPELFSASLQVQQFPTALRLHESAFGFLRRGLSKAAHDACASISRHMYGEAFDCYLQSPRIADDLERRGIYLNLMSAGEISRQLALEGLNIDDPEEEKVERGKEDLRIQKRLAEVQADAEREAQLGTIDDIISASQQAAQAAPGGAGGGGASQGGAPITTPTMLRDQASQIADQWLAIQSDGERAKEMQKVKGVNSDLYAVAKDLMDEKRRQMASQGKEQILAQVQQGAQA